MPMIFDKENINPDVPALVIMSHGGVSLGACETIEMLTGDKVNVIAIGLEPGENLESYTAKLDEVYKAVPKDSIYFVDIFGGTPFNTVMQYCRNNNVVLNTISGFNVPMLLEGCIMRNSMSGKDLMLQLLAQEEHGVANVTEKIEALLNK